MDLSQSCLAKMQRLLLSKHLRNIDINRLLLIHESWFRFAFTSGRWPSPTGRMQNPSFMHDTNLGTSFKNHVLVSSTRNTVWPMSCFIHNIHEHPWYATRVCDFQVLPVSAVKGHSSTCWPAGLMSESPRDHSFSCHSFHPLSPSGLPSRGPDGAHIQRLKPYAECCNANAQRLYLRIGFWLRLWSVYQSVWRLESSESHALQSWQSETKLKRGKTPSIWKPFPSCFCTW